MAPMIFNQIEKEQEGNDLGAEHATSNGYYR